MNAPFFRSDHSFAFPSLCSLGLAVSFFLGAPTALAQGKAASAGPAVAGSSSAGSSSAGSAAASSGKPNSKDSAPAPASSVAPSPAAASQDPATDARVLYLKGNAAFKRGDDILARDYYQKSLALRESFDTYCNLGRAEDLSALTREAYFHLGLCLRFYPPDEDLAGPREKYAALREEIGSRLAPEEMVDIDHRVQAHQPRTQTGPAISVPTEPAQPAPAAEPAPPVPAPDPVPRYSPARLPVSLTVGVLGAAGVGVGVGFLVDSQKQRDEGRDLRQRMQDQDLSCTLGEDNHASCQRLDQLYDRADRNFIIGVASAATGGALLVGSVFLYAFWPERRATATAEHQGSQPRHAARGWFQVGQVALRPTASVLSIRGGGYWGIQGQF